MERYYYIEIDGMVYLVEEGGRLRFPRSPELEGLDFRLEVKHRMVIEGKEVLFSKPEIDYYPKEWWPKDKIPLLDKVDPLVRAAVHLSLPRVVVEGVTVRGGKILLVKAKRGYLKGRWNLPGGFVGYGESPEEAVKREVEEEIGARCATGRLLGVESFIGESSYSHWFMFFYEMHLLEQVKEFRPAADEIAEVRWFPLQEAIELIGSPVMRKKVREIYKLERE
ncbi:TPA: NUDIX hydrolase [Candidatus Bipolaricaulota bacterium]|nr:NUDIX hydrolase [Candidatus Bipolaricaulota bacterium]